MNNKNKKINFTLTVFGLLGSCGIANAQQLKQEAVKPNAAVPTMPVKAPVVNTAPNLATPAAVVATPAKVEVAVAQPVSASPAKAEEVKPEVKKEEAKKPEVKEKLQIVKAFNERAKLIEKYGSGRGLLLGLFPGSVAVVDTTSYIARYLPLSNHLTVGTGELVSFIPELNVKTLKDRVVKGKYDILYVNAEVATVALKSGYEPLAQRSEKIVSTVLTKKGSNIGKVQDLAAAKVGAVPQAMVTTLARANFKKNNVNVNLIGGGLTGQKELFLGLDDGNFDAVVVRKEAADELIAKNPEKYKLALVLDEAPGFILMAKKDLPASTRENLARSIISLSQDNANDKAVLAGMDAKGGGYTKIDPKEIEAFENKIKIVE
jgi:ABC-type phosphate/phosphonate transport system substrate-binding protein